MPFARVGVMPQPNQDGQSNMNQKVANPSSGRQKGITMEDLKKQTAIRLAQEQQQHRGYPNANGEDSTMNQQSNNQYPSENLQQNQGYPHTRYPQGESHREQYHHSVREVPPTPYQQPFQQNQYQQPNNNNYQRTGYENYPSSYRSGVGQTYDESANSLHYQNQNVQAQELVNNPYGANNRFLIAPDPFPNKLTHGLTVQELKQMTQARLQAAERLSPLDFDASVHEVRERAMSRDSTGRGRGFHQGVASESTNSIPSLVQVGQAIQSQPWLQPRASPVPVGFQSFNPKSPNATSLDSNSNFVMPPQQTWDSGHQQLKLDALETASMNSYNNSVISDNLGSESAYSTGIGSGMLSQTDSDLASIPFNRSLPYTGGPLMSNDGKMVDRKPAASSTSASPASYTNAFCFDAAVGGGNRHRAATLSPNPVSILEGRPHFDGQGLAMPKFSSSGGVSLLARSRGNSSSSILPSQHADNTLFGQTTGMFAFDEGANRARTESSVSLPPLSHTADEFGVDRVFSHQFVSQGREGPATGYSVGNNFGDAAMRERQVLAPPGFSGNSGYTFNSTGDDALASEMRSILNLSGEGTNRQRLNTYPQSEKSHTPEYISEDFFN